MTYSSIAYILYFLPIVLMVYYIFYFSTKLQNVFLFLASLLFYAWVDYRFVYLIVLSILYNVVIGNLLDACKDKKRLSRVILSIAVIMNLSCLFAFKYQAIARRDVNKVFGTHFSIYKVLLPLGISFFILKGISYIVDVYKGDAKAEKNPINVGLYMAYFPLILAGPLVKYGDFSNQIKKRTPNLQKFSVGCCRFLVGLSKQIILVNNIAIVADRIFEENKLGELPITMAWLGALAVMLEIYYEVSAVSDMAIGVSAMLGIRLNENVNYPYISKSVSDFYRRFNILVFDFFKHYVYEPLGGAKVVNQDKMVRNIFILFLTVGLWLGADHKYILWACVTFLMIITEKLLDVEKWKNNSFLKHSYTLIFIGISWILLRSTNCTQAVYYIGNMFGLRGNCFKSVKTAMLIKEFFPFLGAGILFSMPISRNINIVNMKKKIPVVHTFFEVAYPIVMIVLFIICISYLVAGSYNPFVIL